MESDEFGGYLEDGMVRMSLPAGRAACHLQASQVSERHSRWGAGRKGLKAGRAGVKGSEVRKGMVPPMSLSRNASEAGVLEG